MRHDYYPTREQAARRLGAKPLPLLLGEVAEYRRKADAKWLAFAILDLVLIVAILTLLTGLMAYGLSRLPPI